MQKEKFSKKMMFGCLFLFFMFFPTIVVNAATTDSLYTHIDKDGNYIDGNKTEIKYDKPVIRPSYVGTSILDDYSGPTGQFQGFWGERGPGYSDDFWGQQYSIKSGTVIKNVGYYKGKSLALKVSFTNKFPNWTQKVTLARNGGLNVSPDLYGMEFRLVYNDGVFNIPVEDVYVEIPVLSNPTSKNDYYNYYSKTIIKQSNLVRIFFNEEEPARITNVVTRENHSFSNSSGESYTTGALLVNHQFLQVNNSSVRKIKQTFIFDNKEPLVLAESRSLNISTVTTLFKSSMKTPGEISYLPPRTNGSQNTTKFEANFDITQALNDGYEQYFPDSLSLVMLDDENMFKSLQLSDMVFEDQSGKDISSYFEKILTNDHQLEFKIKKSELIRLGSNQINAKISADNLDSKAVLQRYDETENVYTVPVKFYNYKIYKGQKTESDKMLAIAKIVPNIYGDAADDVTAGQYTYSGDLDIANLLKNVSTTIPSDTLKTEIVDQSIYFDTVKTYNVDVKISSTATTNTKTISVPVNIIKAIPVTSEYFENQVWLIDEINRQFADKNKKIDENLYMTDLLKITSITNRTGADFLDQHIPKTIAALENLEVIDLKDKHLSGNLPDELGELTKLTKLSIFGNNFSGGIPKTLSKLENLTFLALDNNKLTGTVPSGLEKLSKLKQVYLNKNQLVGTIATFDLGPFSNFAISETQLTYNDKLPPNFITKSTQYRESFVAGANNLSLTGTENMLLSLKRPTVKPFDPTSEGYLDLQAKKADGTKIDLYSGHTFQIFIKKDEESQQEDFLLYDGPADPTKRMVFDSDLSYKVIMDNADKNPNNVFEFKPNLREYKLSEVPKTMSLDLKIGDLNYQPVKISRDDSLSIFDNRVDNQWQLKVKVYPLQNKTKRLAGDFFYKGSDAIPKILTASSNFHVIESGKSNPNSETIDLGKEWDENRGLFYKQASTANYKDSYTGKLEWQMVDAPNGS